MGTVTVKSIAASVGVSPSVVSAVLNGSKHVRVGEATRRRVLAKVEELGYRPNLAARSLRTAQSGVLAVIAPKLYNPVFTPALDGIHDAAEASGYAVLLAEATRLVTGSKMLGQILGRGQIDGTLMRSTAGVEPAGVRALVERDSPIVLMDSADDPTQPWVVLDDVAAARLATQHLLDRGHTRIGFVGGRLGPREGDQPAGGFRHTAWRRVDGYFEAMTAAGLEPTFDAVFESDFAAADGYGAIERVLAVGDPPSAVVVNNATTSIGVVAGAIDAGLAVPDDLAIVAIHDTEVLEDIRPSITAVRLPMYGLGYQGVLLLDRAIKGESIISTMVSSPRPVLVQRSSS